VNRKHGTNLFHAFLVLEMALDVKGDMV